MVQNGSKRLKTIQNGSTRKNAPFLTISTPWRRRDNGGAAVVAAAAAIAAASAAAVAAATTLPRYPANYFTVCFDIALVFHLH